LFLSSGYCICKVILIFTSLESSSPCLSTGICIFFKVFTKSGYFCKNLHIEPLCTPHTGQYCYTNLEIELLCRDLRIFEIRFEFESNASDSIRKWRADSNRPHLPSYHKLFSLFNKNFNRCAYVIEIYFMFMILAKRDYVTFD